MSNRDGKNAHASQKYKEGKKCPKCTDGRLVACDCSNCKGNRKWNVRCTKCWFSNY